jgi:hypothetical protein
MKLARVLLSKTALTTLLIVAGLIAFNALYFRLETEQLASFNSWYSTVQPVLQNEDGGQVTASKLQVTIRLNGADRSPSWSFPAQSLSVPEDRERTTRVLQLISESKVFGLPSSSKESDSLTIAVSDESASFSTTVRRDSVKDNIQIQNLLKLLEIYATTPLQPVNPAQL